MDRIPAALRRTRFSPTRSRLLALAFLAALAALLVLAPAALADYLTPESQSGSQNAKDIDTLYKVVLVVGVIVYVGVMGTMIYCLVRFRHRKGAIAAQIHGNTRLEIGWTAGAALILVVLTVITFIKLPGIKDPPDSGPNGLPSASANGVLFAQVDRPDPPNGRGLHITVQGQQYVWRFSYDDERGVYSYGEMIVPINTTVLLNIEAQDVMHSWWIPALGGKMDAIPGYTNRTWFKISRPGLYRGQCAELCGRNHANMVAQVRAVPVNEYRAWVLRQRTAIQGANRLVQQRQAAEDQQQNR